MFSGAHCVRDFRGRLHVVGGTIVRTHSGRLVCAPSVEQRMADLHLSTASDPVSKIRAALLARAGKK